MHRWIKGCVLDAWHPCADLLVICIVPGVRMHKEASSSITASQHRCWIILRHHFSSKQTRFSQEHTCLNNPAFLQSLTRSSHEKCGHSADAREQVLICSRLRGQHTMLDLHNRCALKCQRAYLSGLPSLRVTSSDTDSCHAANKGYHCHLPTISELSQFPSGSPQPYGDPETVYQLKKYLKRG